MNLQQKHRPTHLAVKQQNSSKPGFDEYYIYHQPLMVGVKRPTAPPDQVINIGDGLEIPHCMKDYIPPDIAPKFI